MKPSHRRVAVLCRVRHPDRPLRAMRRGRATIEIDAPLAVVWTLLAEFRHWPSWGPTVSAVESDAEAVAAGVTGRVKTVAGVWLPFEITAAQEHRSWDWKVAGIPATGHCVSAIDASRTLVEFTVPAVFAPYLLVLRSGLRRLRRIAETA